MITIYLDDTSQTPKSEQIYLAIRDFIRDRSLVEEEALPSKRKLAEHLKVSVTTIESAYDQLLAEGYIHSILKVGYFVEHLEPSFFNIRPQEAVLWKREIESKVKWDLKTNAVDETMFPYDKWIKLQKEVLADEVSWLNQRNSFGEVSLREQIAKYLKHFRGIDADVEQIIIGAGFDYFIYLLTRLFPNRIVAVENPGYSKTKKLYAMNAAKVVPVDLDDSGLQVSELMNSKASIVQVSPSHQFPTGVVMGIKRRLDLLRWATEADNRMIIEDDYDSEFRFATNPIPALQGLDHLGKVIYLNSFSKSVGPSFRLSFMVLPKRLVDTFREQFGFLSCTVSVLEQRLFAKFMESGNFERHLSRMKTVYKIKRDEFLGLFKHWKNGSELSIFGHESGLHFVLRMPGKFDYQKYQKQCLDRFLRIWLISEYQEQEITNDGIVIGYAHLTHQEMNEISAIMEEEARTCFI